MAPEVFHLVFTVVGMALGWYIKHQSIGIPPELLDALQKLFASKQQKDSHATLQDLLAHLESQQVPPPPRT